MPGKETIIIVYMYFKAKNLYMLYMAIYIYMMYDENKCTLFKKHLQ